MAYKTVDVDIEIELEDFSDDEIEQEYLLRFKNKPAEINNVSVDLVYDFIHRHYWSPEQWARLQDELDNANRYGQDL